jgi:hypothetical protein
MRINHLSVLVAAVAFYVWSTIWFLIFGHQWQAFTGRSSGDIAPTTYVLSFVIAIVLAYVVATALADSDKPNMVRHGVEFGIFMSAGIWLTNLLALSLYEGRPLGLWLIDGFQIVIGMAIMGAIVGAMRKRTA